MTHNRTGARAHEAKGARGNEGREEIKKAKEGTEKAGLTAGVSRSIYARFLLTERLGHEFHAQSMPKPDDYSNDALARSLMSPQERSSRHDGQPRKSAGYCKNAAAIQASDTARVFLILITKTVIAAISQSEAIASAHQ